MSLKWMKGRVCMTLVLLLTPLLLSAKVFLVAVGISDYPGTENDLNLPVNDAKTVVKLYKQNTGLQFLQLFDRQATRGNIVAAMKKVYAKAGPNDLVVFFYSGHGYAGGFYAYDGELDYSHVRKAMSNCKSKYKMIFADACFSGKIRTGKRDDTAGVSQARKANVMLFLSSRSNEYSLEQAGMRNGYFTTYLVKGLKGNADRNKDRVVTAKELFDYVHSNVINGTDDEQHPVMWGNFSNNMPVMIWK